MPIDAPQTPPPLRTFDDALGRRVIAMHVWAVQALCETLGRKVLVSAELAAAAQHDTLRLEPLGRHVLRGVREAREIFALDRTAKTPGQVPN